MHITVFARNIMEYREPTANNETNWRKRCRPRAALQRRERAKLGQAREFRSGTRSLSRNFNGSANKFDTVFSYPAKAIAVY